MALLNDSGSVPFLPFTDKNCQSHSEANGVSCK
jgi:hypothetical protein